MATKQYDHIWTTEDLDKPDRYTLIQSDIELADTLDFVGLPEEDRADITSAIVIADDGCLYAVWLSEDSRPYDLSAWYHPLPFYLPEDQNTDKLPAYWLESNQLYHK